MMKRNSSVFPGGGGMVDFLGGSSSIKQGNLTDALIHELTRWNNSSSDDGEEKQAESDFLSFPNGTEEWVEIPFPAYIQMTSTLLCGIILFIGIVGNILVPIVVIRNKELRSSTNIFLVNLSVADLLVLLICMPPILIELHTKQEMWIMGAAMCKLVPFAELSVAHASVLTILAISLERYIAICCPLRANYTCTKNRAIAICLGIWIVAFVATSPALVISQQHERNYMTTQVNVCLMALTWWPSFYFLSVITIFFFVPLFALIALYWVIARNLMSDPYVSSESARSFSNEHPNMRTRRQVVVMLATVVFFFFVCLLPFRIFSVYVILAPNPVQIMGMEVYYTILYICRVMLYFNSAINPILYNVMSSKFREAFFKVLGCPVGSRNRSRWICRHLSRQSTFTTSTTLQTSSMKSSFGKNGFHGESIRIRELGEKNGLMIFCGNPGAGSSSMTGRKQGEGRNGPYYPPKRQMSHEETQQKLLNQKSVLRANSVV